MPRIMLLGTGGTIANSREGRLSLAEVLAQLPADVGGYDLQVEESTRVASSALGLDDFLDVARRVRTALTGAERPDGSSSPWGPTRPRISPTCCT